MFTFLSIISLISLGVLFYLSYKLMDFLEILNKFIKESVEFYELSLKKNELILNTFENKINWEKEVHRLLLNEYASFPKDKVYGLLYFNPRTNVEKITLVTANTFEEAQDAGLKILQTEGQNVFEWMIKGYTSVNIPRIKKEESKKIIEKIEKEKFSDAERPIESFIHTLQLASDRFAVKKAQKRSIEEVIKTIKESYGNSIK